MLFVKIVGILFLCSLAAAEMITFKPFLKSRYSLRERRAKSTTKIPLSKANDTNIFLTTEAETEAVTQHLPETTLVVIEKQLGDSKDQSSSTPIVTTPSTPITTTTSSTTKMAIEIITLSEDKPNNSSPGGINSNKEVTDKMLATDTITSKKVETTTQTEWVYDYYASDDENPRRNA